MSQPQYLEVLDHSHLSDCTQNFIRASRYCKCPVCQRPYDQHPYCSNSKIVERFSGQVYYYLHVLCEGTHVKL